MSIHNLPQVTLSQYFCSLIGQKIADGQTVLLRLTLIGHGIENLQLRRQGTSRGHYPASRGLEAQNPNWPHKMLRRRVLKTKPLLQQAGYDSEPKCIGVCKTHQSGPPPLGMPSSFSTIITIAICRSICSYITHPSLRFVSCG